MTLPGPLELPGRQARVLRRPQSPGGAGRWGFVDRKRKPGSPPTAAGSRHSLHSAQPEQEAVAMALPSALGLGLLLTLPPGVLSSGSKAKSDSSSLTVVLLLLLLLLLVAGLALAWRRLSRDSGGYYHPARLGAALWGRTRRLLWASPPGRWLQARAEAGLEKDPECPEHEQDSDDDEDDYQLDGGGQEVVDMREESLRCGEGPGAQEGPEEAEEAQARGDGRAGLGLGSRGAAGSAEALLNDLHAFAGSAAWDDSGVAALHVTAL
ncbi:protein tyrosine phosphatase receptor type C-associated protein [Erinaceus europaeus]|uniref:Protein tyrosine phosphatase receptor type C-associated protein n=1 Tax=Erinaceus europaeus TaxID=9365 RepID=A0ABM3W5T9_ERIEU|nr:protein tyrosine phosphatase receptor type C-associated protein [Erinaceus europaeus]